MGTKMAPAYAGIFMSSLEEPFLATQPLKPLLFRRYIDILIVWEHGHQQLITFLTALNALRETIKFIWEISEDSVIFLDVDIYKQRKEDNTTLAYRTHFKATNSFQYVHNTSYHPKATKQGIIKGELTRISNTTSDTEVRDQTLDFLTTKFRYPFQTVCHSRQILTTHKEPKEDHLSPQDPLCPPESPGQICSERNMDKKHNRP